jgi:class 3 adenylate cyclase
VSETRDRFARLRESADARSAEAIEALVREGGDRALHRVNVFDFAAAHGLREDRALGAFLHAARLGLFDMSWNLLCPGCGGVLDANATLKTVRRDTYNCALCGAGYQPTLDEMVEVSFTVNPRVRRIAAHDPEALPIWEYSRQMYWSSGIDLPADDRVFEALVERMVIDSAALAPGDERTLSVTLPAQFCIVFDPVTHAAQFIDVQGAPARSPQALRVAFRSPPVPNTTVRLQPGPLELTFENHTSVRVLPGLFIAGHDLHALLGRRKRYLTAKQVLSNQTFRDLHRTDALDVDQRLSLTSLTFLFTDLKGSTEMYERVGDLVAYDLVKAHFRVLNDVIAERSGAVVKTIGDAVMATFPTPAQGLDAALRMRDAMRALNEARGREDLTLKIGLHEGPCLAVTLNDRLDYFGQTVNIAARVQGLAVSRAIFATQPVIEHPAAARLLSETGITPMAQECTLRGISETFRVYQIP